MSKKNYYINEVKIQDHPNRIDIIKNNKAILSEYCIDFKELKDNINNSYVYIMKNNFEYYLYSINSERIIHNFLIDKDYISFRFFKKTGIFYESRYIDLISDKIISINIYNIINNEVNKIYSFDFDFGENIHYYHIYYDNIILDYYNKYKVVFIKFNTKKYLLINNQNKHIYFKNIKRIYEK